MNHAWRHLWGSPTEHFKKTLLTRSQHLLILLADWMSAVALQATFYGKSQVSIRQKAEMTATTALFMIPTALAFPAMMRMANTPPSSQTLPRVRKHHNVLGPQPFRRHEQVIGLEDGLVKMQHEEFHAALSARATPKKAPMRGLVVENAAIAVPLPSQLTNHRAKRPALILPAAHVVDNAGGVGTNETDVYRELIATQRVLVALYTFVPLCMAIFVSMVFRVMREAEG
ncbi:unnamed protein product, partial [Ectocarpus sp. 8 AP-2014]